MTPEQGARLLVRRAASLPRNCVQAMEATQRKGIVIAHRWSSGPITSLQLAKMGHPYGLNFPGSPPQPTGQINRQSGTFWGDWEASPAFLLNKDVYGTIYNIAPYAKYLDRGTTRMIARPIKRLIRSELRPVFRANIKSGVHKSLSLR